VRKPDSSLLATSIKFSPILVWISWGVGSDDESDCTFYNRHEGKAPAIFLICLDDNIPHLLESHFNGNTKRVARLRESPEWILLDLEVILLSWTDTWDLARQELVARTVDVNASWHKSDLFNLTKFLHQDIANIIALREDLRLQKTTTQRYQRLLDRFHGQLSTPLGFTSSSSTTANFENLSSQSLELELRERLDDSLHNLSHQQDTSEVILKQFENLMSLVSCLFISQFDYMNVINWILGLQS
jgi:hypothetical protein